MFRDYFERFMPEAFSEVYMESFPLSRDPVQFIIRSEEQDSSWMVQLEGDKVCVTEGLSENTRCRYTLDSEVFKEIISGRSSPQSFFFRGKLKIRGDIVYALQLGALLEVFFKENPYE